MRAREVKVMRVSVLQDREGNEKEKVREGNYLLKDGYNVRICI